MRFRPTSLAARTAPGLARRRRSLLQPIATMLILTLSLSATLAQPVAVVTTNRSGPYGQAMQALLETLRRGAPQNDVRSFDLEAGGENVGAVLTQVHQANPALIVTVGSPATATVLAGSWSSPIVFSMVLYPAQSGYVPGRNVTGVSLDVPLDVQFQTLRRLLPGAHRVGVLYHRTETGSVVAAARTAAARHGFMLETKDIDQPSEVPGALPEFLASIDAVWTVADSHVLSPQSTTALILQALRMWVPVFGLSSPHVELGALAALSCDYADVGSQSGELALRVLKGESAASIMPESPRKISLALNLRSAQHLGLAIAPDVEREAQEVIR